ncbi:PREDICTED: uncharacterized protein LOC106815449 [Priapulus caudatus]|uniref:Uncharacterized protein LOC106815449 n=1 Tax=Priapulus caudatus TaxID=37621 RepID=A0ABM1ET72_PRICU|nr:PREDICTED: uncharacterized protein LOC106815449 [Priapulus caudatus]
MRESAPAGRGVIPGVVVACTTPLPPGKKYVAVTLLTNEQIYVIAEVKSKLKPLYDSACFWLGLKSPSLDIFGLAQIVEEEYHFVDLEKKVNKFAPKNWKSQQSGLDSNGKPTVVFYLQVQFYLDHHLLLTDRISRYLYYLQLRRNLVFTQHLRNEEQCYLLASYALQADLGNFNEDKHVGQYFDPALYLPSWLILLHGPDYAVTHIPVIHRSHRGISRAEAQVQYIIDASREGAAHNMNLHKLKDRKTGTLGSVLIGIHSCGIDVYKVEGGSTALLYSFLWPKIGKLHFEKKKFEIRAEGWPESRKLTYYTGTEFAARYLLTLCQTTHQFNMQIQPRLHEIAKREKQGKSGMRQNRESYIYSDDWDLALEQEYQHTLSFHDFSLLPVGKSSVVDNRFSVISTASSNTTSGIVSDKVHSLDESEDDLYEDEGATSQASADFSSERLEAGMKNQRLYGATSVDSMLALDPGNQLRNDYSTGRSTKKSPRMGILSLAASTPSLKSAASSLGISHEYFDLSEERRKPAMGMLGRPAAGQIYVEGGAPVRLRERCGVAEKRRPKSLGAFPDTIEEINHRGLGALSGLLPEEIKINAALCAANLSQLDSGRFKMHEELSNVTSTSEQTSTSADTEATLAHVQGDSIHQWTSAHDLCNKGNVYKDLLSCCPHSQYRHLPKWLSLGDLDTRNLHSGIPQLEHYDWSDMPDMPGGHMYSRSLSPESSPHFDANDSPYIPEDQIAVRLPPPLSSFRPSARWGMLESDEVAEVVDLVYDEPPSYPAAMRKLTMNMGSGPCTQGTTALPISQSTQQPDSISMMHSVSMAGTTLAVSEATKAGNTTVTPGGHVSQDSVSSVCEAPDVHPVITEIRGLTKSYEGLPLLAALCNDVSLLPPGNKADCKCRVHRHHCHIVGDADPRRWSHAGVQASHMSMVQDEPSRPVSWHYDDRDLNMIHFGDCLNNMSCSCMFRISAMSSCSYNHMSQMSEVSSCCHSSLCQVGDMSTCCLQAQLAHTSHYTPQSRPQPTQIPMKPPPPYRPPQATSSNYQAQNQLFYNDAEIANGIYLTDNSMHNYHKQGMYSNPQHDHDLPCMHSAQYSRDSQHIYKVDGFAHLHARLYNGESIA